MAEGERGIRLEGAPEPHKMIAATGGVHVAADIYGDSGPLVILQHGGGQTRHAWKSAGQMLADAGYRAISLDARGHGDSEWAPDGDYSNDVLVDDLVAVIEHFGQQPILVGASMGGGTSLTAVGEGRVDATALVLVDTAPRIEVAGVRKIRDFMRQAPDGFSSLDEVAEAIANYQPHRKRPRTLDGLAKKCASLVRWPISMALGSRIYAAKKIHRGSNTPSRRGRQKCSVPISVSAGRTQRRAFGRGR